MISRQVGSGQEGRRHGVATAALVAFAAMVSASGPVSAGSPGPEGFADPVPLIPAIGIWVDGLTQAGFARKTGLVLWWDLEPPAASGDSALRRVDWRRVTYRIRAEAFPEKGASVETEEALVEPLRSDGSRERGGFPTPLRLALKPGPYRVHLEAYPLISAVAAGLDSVPRGVADVEVQVPEMSVRSSGWRMSDVLFFRAARKWEPGGPSERAWYDWIVSPSVSRSFAADSTTSYLGFEVLRSTEVVPRCPQGKCRVVATIRDAQGGVLQQELRPVPDAGSVSAYLIPFRADSLPAGTYTAEVEIFEGADLLASTDRRFRVR